MSTIDSSDMLLEAWDRSSETTGARTLREMSVSLAPPRVRAVRDMVYEAIEDELAELRFGRTPWGL